MSNYPDDFNSARFDAVHSDVPAHLQDDYAFLDSAIKRIVDRGVQAIYDLVRLEVSQYGFCTPSLEDDACLREAIFENAILRYAKPATARLVSEGITPPFFNIYSDAYEAREKQLREIKMNNQRRPVSANPASFQNHRPFDHAIFLAHHNPEALVTISQVIGGK